MKNKIIALYVGVLAAAFLPARAQVRLEPFNGYSKFTIGGGFGFTHLYGNWNHTNAEPVGKVNFARNVNKWINVNVELQKGGLNDYETKQSWTDGLSVYNNFTAGAITGNIALGEIYHNPKSDLAKHLCGIYVGTGIGYMHNNITNITLKFKQNANNFINNEFPGTIKTESNNFYLPMNLGIDLHIAKVVMFNINYQLNYAFSDYIDGYKFSKSNSRNNYNDLYSTLVFGLHFYIGAYKSSKEIISPIETISPKEPTPVVLPKK